MEDIGSKTFRAEISKVRVLLDPMNEAYQLQDIRDASLAFSSDTTLRLQKAFPVFDTGREILAKAAHGMTQRAEDKQVLSILEKVHTQSSALSVFSKTEATDSASKKVVVPEKSKDMFVFGMILRFKFDSKKQFKI